jgi:nitrite reductase/ring-hydroxylating ferredoxin subunit
VWIAIGRVERGNGLAIFTKDYQTQFAFRDGYILPGAKLHKPENFDLEPGDVVLFHSNHLHASELNRTTSTRYVVSYRVTFGKPHYPHGHYHHYQHVGLASGPLRWLASVPQNLQWSFVRYQVRRIAYKLTGRGRMTGSDSSAVKASANTPAPASASIDIGSFPIGSIVATSENTCLARVGEQEFSAVSRYCPHMGGDLTGGWLDNGRIVCPLHGLPFDLRTGESPCRSLKPLRVFPTDLTDGRVSVQKPAQERVFSGSTASAKTLSTAD